jgi:hypothetical protein
VVTDEGKVTDHPIEHLISAGIIEAISPFGKQILPDPDGMMCRAARGRKTGVNHEDFDDFQGASAFAAHAAKAKTRTGHPSGHVFL